MNLFHLRKQVFKYFIKVIIPKNNCQSRKMCSLKNSYIAEINQFLIKYFHFLLVAVIFLWCNTQNLSRMIYFNITGRFQKQPPEVYYKKAILKNYAIFTTKHLFWCLFLIKFINKLYFNKLY